MSKLTEIGQPEFTHRVGLYDFQWKDIGLSVQVERLTDEGAGELVFYHNNGHSKPMLLHRTRANLLSTPTMAQLAKRLEKNKPDIDWTLLLTYVAGKSIETLRTGTALVSINEAPESMALDYLLRPFLVKNVATTVYAPGSSAKSILADFIAVLVQFGVCWLDWIPSPGNVLYLDWESTEQEHRRYVTAIKAGLGVQDDTPILYRRCDRPLASLADTIRKDIFDYQIGLVILDSVMAATATSGHGQDGAQIAGEYYNILNSFGCTTLNIDHVSKEVMAGFVDSVAPYGSVVKYNRSRSQFEVKLHQEAGDDSMELAIIHKKFNLGRRLKPFGVRINFVNANDVLKSIQFKKMNIADNPVLAHNLTITDRIIAILKRRGAMDPDALTAEAGDKQGSVLKALQRGVEKGLFVKVGTNSYGLSQ